MTETFMFKVLANPTRTKDIGTRARLIPSSFPLAKLTDRRANPPMKSKQASANWYLISIFLPIFMSTKQATTFEAAKTQRMSPIIMVDWDKMKSSPGKKLYT